jgi:uncharacterized protein (UPF0332 family)
MISQLSNKSEMNFSAAEQLQKNAHYCSTVHCSYYSSLQLIKHILLHRVYGTEEQLSAKKDGNEGLHEFYINEVVKFLKNNNKDWRTVNTEINQLKKLRVKADYKDLPVDFEDGRKSILLAGNTNKILKQVA